MTGIWIFHGDGATLATAVFTTKEDADKWISKNFVSGVLTCMPINEGIYDWAIKQQYFEPQKDHQKSGAFIQKFTSGYLEHYHYVNGVLYA